MRTPHTHTPTRTIAAQPCRISTPALDRMLSYPKQTTDYLCWHQLSFVFQCLSFRTWVIIFSMCSGIWPEEDCVHKSGLGIFPMVRQLFGQSICPKSCQIIFSLVWAVYSLMTLMTFKCDIYCTLNMLLWWWYKYDSTPKSRQESLAFTLFNILASDDLDPKAWKACHRHSLRSRLWGQSYYSILRISSISSFCFIHASSAQLSSDPAGKLPQPVLLWIFRFLWVHVNTSPQIWSKDVCKYNHWASFTPIIVAHHVCHRPKTG